MTGLAAGYASGAPVFEAAAQAGGICSSYQVSGYRFEVGGGHWIFGGDAATLERIQALSPSRRYERRSAVYFPESRRYVPFPLQDHLPAPDAPRAELPAPRTMAEWLLGRFGASLCELFFFPFHELYTAGLYRTIAPQDDYKSPRQSPGYNASFLYPEQGLDHLARRLAQACTIRYGMRAVQIDTAARVVHFANGEAVKYDRVIATLPLNRLLDIAGLSATPDPYTSVLVLNIGAVRGRDCPDEHWIYTAGARSGFHRVGFYSNVAPAFVSHRDRVGLYVERAFPGGARPTDVAVQAYAADVVRELQEWGYIGDVEVVDPSWVDVAYTWRWPGSRWVPDALDALERHGIAPVGRYARWRFQGIADSLRDGFACAR